MLTLKEFVDYPLTEKPYVPSDLMSLCTLLGRGRGLSGDDAVFGCAAGDH